jgi:hypothetical protein
MKSKTRILLAFFLGVITAKCAFDLAGWSYNPFHETFVFWKVLLKYATSVLATLVWLLIFQLTFRMRTKDDQYIAEPAGCTERRDRISVDNRTSLARSR